MIVFQKTEKTSRMRNPLKNFKEDTVTFEYRTDPLTGRNSTIIRGMLSYVSKFLISDQDLLNSLVEKTRDNCPFCPENIQTKTPMFPQDFRKEGRITIGDACVVPNLLGHAERSVAGRTFKGTSSGTEGIRAEDYHRWFSRRSCLSETAQGA